MLTLSDPLSRRYPWFLYIMRITVTHGTHHVRRPLFYSRRSVAKSRSTHDEDFRFRRSPRGIDKQYVRPRVCFPAEITRAARQDSIISRGYHHIRLRSLRFRTAKNIDFPAGANVFFRGFRPRSPGTRARDNEDSNEMLARRLCRV